MRNINKLTVTLLTLVFGMSFLGADIIEDYNEASKGVPTSQRQAYLQEHKETVESKVDSLLLKEELDRKEKAFLWSVAYDLYIYQVKDVEIETVRPLIEASLDYNYHPSRYAVRLFWTKQEALNFINNADFDVLRTAAEASRKYGDASILTNYISGILGTGESSSSFIRGFEAYLKTLPDAESQLAAVNEELRGLVSVKPTDARNNWISELKAKSSILQGIVKGE